MSAASASTAPSAPAHIDWNSVVADPARNVKSSGVRLMHSLM